LRTIFGSKLSSRSRGHFDPDRADLGGHGLGPMPVTAVAAAAARPLVTVTAQVIGDLIFQS
jgi:hypothetical protein